MAVLKDRGCDSAIGCLIGLTLGDAVGAPLEFCAVDPSSQARILESREWIRFVPGILLIRRLGVLFC